METRLGKCENEGVRLIKAIKTTDDEHIFKSRLTLSINQLPMKTTGDEPMGIFLNEYLNFTIAI